MSINFKEDLSDSQQAMIQKLFGREVEAMDKRIVLLNTREVLRSDMSEVARETNQVVELELNEEGDIKTLSDGSKYRVTKEGWKKI